MFPLTWTLGLLRRRRGRLIGATLGTATAVALIASIGAFLSASKATMTTQSISSVPVAWQVEVQRGGDPAAVARTVSRFPGVTRAVPVLFAPTPGFQANTAGTTQTTGAGVVVGLDGGYRAAFPDQIRSLLGTPTGILLSQQTAANLHAGLGDIITVGRDGLSPAAVTVAGIVDLPGADSFFQKVGSATASQPAAPPDNVLIVPTDIWHELFDQVTATRPELVSTQIHTTYDRPLPPDPSAAYAQVLREAHKLELDLSGTGLVGNNLAARLGAARSDSLYAQVLFLFLGVPGAVLAGLVTTSLTAAGADRRRRDQALLRTRGATTRQLVHIALAEAGLVTTLGTVIGLVAALIIGRVTFGAANFGATTTTAALWIVGASLAAFGIALAGVVAPAWRDARELSVVASRRSIGRPRDPRWLRWGVDIGAFAVALVAFWLTSRNGYKLVLAVEGVPTISVNYWAFAAPALLWFATGLLTWRATHMLLRHGRRFLAALNRPMAGELAPIAAATMHRQRRLLARGVSLIGLTAAFAGSTAIFNATYRQQAEVDAVLSNGANVTVVEPPSSTVHPDEAGRLARIAGVNHVTAVQHRFAYVGSDLQDLYGVDPTTIVAATKLQDAYFQGGTARQLMAKLAATPKAVLVSSETARDFQLTLGDVIHLRLQNGSTKQYGDVEFVYAGVVKEFPSAPSDSFILANAAYVSERTGLDAVGEFLIDTKHGDSTNVARRVQAELGIGPQVNDIANRRRTVGASLTAVELSGLTRVELGFALVLTVAACGLVLWLGLNERRRTFAIAALLGARPRQLAGLIWNEASFVTIGGLVAGIATGWGITQMIVHVLTGVFDPPPAGLAIPWTYLLTVTVAALAAVALAVHRAVHATRQPTVEALRDI